jgi:Gas vesicle protein
MTSRAPEGPVFVGNRQPAPQNLADVLERVLDKGIVIVGDIQVRLLDIELLTIKVRLMVASVDKAKEMGIDWWESDPFVSSLADDEKPALEERLKALEERIDGSGGDREQ